MMSPELPSEKACLVVILIDPVVHKVLSFINQAINLYDEERGEITENTFFKLIGVVYYTHNFGCSLRKGIETLQRLGQDTPSTWLCRYIMTCLSAFVPTLRRDHAVTD